MNTLPKVSTKMTSDQQTLLDKALVEMIITDYLPFNIVNKHGFQSFLQAAIPSYSLPSRPKLQDLLDDHFNEKLVTLKELCNTADYISYTADLWKSEAKQYFLSIALHFIDKSWKLHSVLISTTHVKGPHSKDLIGYLIKDKIIPFLGTHTKIHSGVTDGGEIASVVHTANSFPDTHKFLKKVESRLCICHQLNNIIKKFLKNYLETYYIVPWRNFIAHLNHSNPFYELFCECRTHFFTAANKEKLQRDSETRWSSTLMMLAKAEKFKEVVIYMFVKSKDEFKPYIPNFSSDSWNLLSKLNAIFAPIIDAIKVLEGDEYPTQNMILFAISMLIDTVKEAIDKSTDINSDYSRLLYVLQELLIALWNSLPQETLIAALVDPRYKSLSHVPETEHEEAWKCLEAEYLSPLFMDKQQDLTITYKEPVNETNSKRKSDLFDIYIKKKLKVSEKPKSEFERYKELPPIAFDRNPFDWWIQNEDTYPIIAQIARIYLAIPASQATCERSFSTARRICTEFRTSLSPSNVEKLTILKQNFSTLYEFETDEELKEQMSQEKLFDPAEKEFNLCLDELDDIF